MNNKIYDENELFDFCVQPEDFIQTDYKELKFKYEECNKKYEELHLKYNDLENKNNETNIKYNELYLKYEDAINTYNIKIQKLIDVINSMGEAFKLFKN